MEKIKPWLLPTALGSVPHVSPAHAWEQLLKYFPEIPAWPQMPRRNFLENMYVQFSAGFPCLVVDKEHIFFDRNRDIDADLERMYIAYLSDDLDAFEISKEYAAGLWSLEAALLGEKPICLKGQITGPVSWGLMVVDQERRPVLYDDVLADAVARHLRMKAAWQEQFLRRYCEQTLIILDEPYMSSFGSAFVAIDRILVLDLLHETLAGLKGMRGVHCCGNTDWSLLLSADIEVLSLDAYGYADTLALYPDDLGAFLEKGGMIAWGIVPNNADVHGETAETLLERFEDVMKMLEAKGIPREQMLENGFITPACGTGGLSPASAERVFALTAKVSMAARQRYLGLSSP